MSSSSSGAAGSVIRTCVGCGIRAAKRDLLRIVVDQTAAVDAEIVADPAARSPGRGAYLHPSLDCLERARRRRAFPRALRVAGPLADAALVSYLTARAEQDMRRNGPAARAAGTVEETG